MLQENAQASDLSLVEFLRQVVSLLLRSLSCKGRRAIEREAQDRKWAGHQQDCSAQFFTIIVPGIGGHGALAVAHKFGA